MILDAFYGIQNLSEHTVMIKLSKYTFLLQNDSEYVIYSARSNSFYDISKELFELLQNIENQNVDTEEKKRIIDKLLKLKILVIDNEDNDYYDSLKFRHYLRSLQSNILTVTLAPTIWCNLKCHYCYENTKPKTIISKEVCDKFIDFLKNADSSNKLSLTWYGGEPLLAIDKIDYILGKIHSDVCNLKFIAHNIVTNGVLLNDKAISVFKKYPLNNIQITLDGIKETHNKIRIRHDGSGTFDEIINNLDYFTKTSPNTNVSVRINIDKNNAQEFLLIKEFIKNKFHGKQNIYVYPGILKGDMSCQDNLFMKTKDVLSFYEQIYEADPTEIYPKIQGKGCTATCAYYYVIGPKGELYNCWEDMGKVDKEIGDIISGKLHERTMRQYIFHGHAFDDNNCKECKILPICFGGCPKDRIENKFHKADNELCSVYKDKDYAGLKHFLWSFYKNNLTKSEF